MARNLLYEKGFVKSMHNHFGKFSSKVSGMANGTKYDFLPRSSDDYTIYALDGCPHSEAAIKKVKNRDGLRLEVYFVNNLGFTKGELHSILLHHTDMDKSHKTWPIIYKEGKFIGGNDSL